MYCRELALDRRSVDTQDKLALLELQEHVNVMPACLDWDVETAVQDSNTVTASVTMASASVSVSTLWLVALTR